MTVTDRKLIIPQNTVCLMSPNSLFTYFICSLRNCFRQIFKTAGFQHSSGSKMSQVDDSLSTTVCSFEHNNLHFTVAFCSSSHSRNENYTSLSLFPSVSVTLPGRRTVLPRMMLYVIGDTFTDSFSVSFSRQTSPPRKLIWFQKLPWFISFHTKAL